MLRERSVGAIVFRKESGKIFYLLLQYEKGYLDFPRGLAEVGEKEEETARREIREETGITDLSFIPGFKEKIRWFYRKGKELVVKEAVYFLAQTKQKEVKVSWEHKGYEWLTFEEASQKLKFETSLEVLRKAENFLHSTFFKI